MQSMVYNTDLDAEELLGEWHPLVDQLGSTEGFMPLSSASEALQLPRVTHRRSLVSFLESYKAKILIPHDLPAIMRAYLHASRNETRELVAYDGLIAREPALREFARASRRVGQNQLKRLRPLRDHRLLQRYLREVESGHADGWHTLVLGLTLSIYSLPVRQGLVLYERQTLQGFVFAAARALNLILRECRAILDDLCSDLPSDLDLLNTPRECVVTSSR